MKYKYIDLFLLFGKSTQKLFTKEKFCMYLSTHRMPKYLQVVSYVILNSFMISVLESKRVVYVDKFYKYFTFFMNTKR